MMPLTSLPACSPRSHVHLAATLLLTTLVYAGVDGECSGMQTCLNSFLNSDVEESATQAFCSLATQTSKCFKSLSSSCRRDIGYQAHRSGLDKLINKYDCHSLLADNNHQTSPVTPENTISPSTQDKCQYTVDSPPAHCGLFGDPHLKTFSGAYMTCGVGGAWPLLDTPSLAIQVTNEQVAPDTHATATTKVTVLVKEHDVCGMEKTYEASADALPRAFVDGTTWTGGSAQHPHTQVQEQMPGEHVLITISHINATVAIRKIEKYLTVFVTLPESEMGEGGELQLCVGGCPDSERLSKAPSLPVASPAMTKSQAINLCKEYNVTDYYLDSCIFDLIATGDKSFRVAALAAQRDLWKHDAAGAKRLLLNCSEPPCMWDVSTAVTSASPSIALFFVIFVLLSGMQLTER